MSIHYRSFTYLNIRLLLLSYRSPNIQNVMYLNQPHETNISYRHMSKHVFGSLTTWTSQNFKAQEQTIWKDCIHLTPFYLYTNWMSPFEKIYLQSANCWLLPIVSGMTAVGWTELCSATPGSCCQVEGNRICWVPPGQACYKTANTKTKRIY